MKVVFNQQGAPDWKVNLNGQSPEQMVGAEWLLTNNRGGFACGTPAGCNTRRYHSMLTGSLNPPANRVVALSNCLETIILPDGQALELSCFEFDKTFHPGGYKYLTAFRKDLGVHWEYDIGVANVIRSLYLLNDSDTAAIVYTFSNLSGPFDFTLRPLTAMRDFHALQNASAPLYSAWNEQEITVQDEADGTGVLALYSGKLRFVRGPQWWYRFFYRQEHRRGQDCFEDLWSPGVFAGHINGEQQVILWACFADRKENLTPLARLDLDIVLDDARLSQKQLLRGCPEQDSHRRQLYLAAGQFVAGRTISGNSAPTILAGFPWFMDWGRDTFISLEGLCLCTGRQNVAAGVLETFAAAVSEGMVPNRFDDYGAGAHYNSIDASLWFAHAAFAYLRATDDRKTFSARLLPAIEQIADAYRRGTRFGIHADDDGLISGGDTDTQLTWMDAKCNGVTFTPRYGKAVEVNALWYEILRHLEDYYRDKNPDLAASYRKSAGQVRESFVRLFWRQETGCLNDCILPNGTVDSRIRPNQIFAVSLTYSPLTPVQQRSVVNVVRQHLLTEYGLRTLSPKDRGYIGRYEGNGFERDRAYHQGTVWPYLMGPFIEAYLRVNNFDAESRKQCKKMLGPLLEHLTQAGCIGSISEVFDGDAPQEAKGCFAQAWSVAEVLRAWMLIND